MTRALVTGAGSYVARCLMERLVALGFSVRGFDAAPVQDPLEDVEYLSGDITRAGLLSDMVRGSDHIFHLFGASPNTPIRRVKGSTASARAMTIKLLTLAENLGVSSFVYLSGSEVYGRPKDGLIDEAERRRPINVSGKQHLIIENHLIQTSSDREVATVILRAPPIIGWGTPKERFPSLFGSLNNAAAGRPVYLIGRGRYLVQYIDVEDLASAMARAILAGTERLLILNVAAEDIVSQKDIADFIFESRESASPLVHLPEAAMSVSGLLRRAGVCPIGSENHILFHPQPIVDPTKGKELLSLTPKRTITSLEETFDYWMEEGER